MEKKGSGAASVCVWRGGGYPGASFTLLTVTLDSHHQYPGPFTERGPAPGTPHTAGFLDRVNICPWGTPRSQECKPRGPLKSARNPLGEANEFPLRVCITRLAQGRDCVFPALSLVPGRFR